MVRRAVRAVRSAAVWLASLWWRGARLMLVDVRWAARRVGYWIRPYDMLADARRWRWQPRQRCGYARAWDALSRQRGQQGARDGYGGGAG